mgnify:CR=1 FL=1
MALGQTTVNVDSDLTSAEKTTSSKLGKIRRSSQPKPGNVLEPPLPRLALRL